MFDFEEPASGYVMAPLDVIEAQIGAALGVVLPPRKPHESVTCLRILETLVTAR